MGLGYSIYQILGGLAAPPVLAAAALKGRFGGRWAERLGYTRPLNRHVRRLMFHGASVGEAGTAAAIIKEFLDKNPDWEIVLTIGTPAGLTQGVKLFADEPRVKVMAPPLDFWGSPDRFLKATRPLAVVIVETELWPGLIEAAHRQNIGLMLAAGRLTARSTKRYLMVKPFMAKLLSRFNLIAAAGDLEKERFLSLGANKEKITILGTPKFDGLRQKAASLEMAEEIADWRVKIWGATRPVGCLLTVGSTHEGEELLLGQAFQKLTKTWPDLKMVVAPRHLGRVGEIKTELEKMGLTVTLADRLTSEEPCPPETNVIILNTMGHLLPVYALADLAVVGGSFFKGEGHNPMEPAVFKTPVIFGPFMGSFRQESEGLVSCGGACQVTADNLMDAISGWLQNQNAAEQAGQKAFDFLAARPPAAPALAEAVKALVNDYF